MSTEHESPHIDRAHIQSEILSALELISFLNEWGSGSFEEKCVVTEAIDLIVALCSTHSFKVQGYELIDLLNEDPGGE